MRGLLIAVLLVGCGEVKGDDGPDTTTFEVVSSTPAADANGVATSVPIVVELSSAIDASTVTATSFTVTGAGQPVAGELAIDGTRITFTPASPWYLLGAYDVTLSTAITNDAGRALEAPYALHFTAVDGAWQPRIDIAADVGEIGYPFARHNRKGDMVIAYASTSSTKDIKVVEYNPMTQTFGVPMNVENLATVFSAPNATINEDGDIIVTWAVPNGPSSQRGWVRRTGGTWNTATVGAGTTGDLALTSDGTAVMAIDVGNGVDIQTLPKTASAWTASVNAFPTSTMGTVSWGIHQSGARAQIVVQDRTAKQIRARGFGPSGLTPIQNLTPTNITMNYVNYDYMPNDDLVFTWWQNDTEIWYSRYTAASDTWAMGEKVSGGLYGAAVCANAAGDRMSAFISSGSMYATFAPAGGAWSTPQNLGSPTGLEYTSCYLDAFGNGHVMFAGYGTTKSFHARFANGAFSQADELEDGPGFNTLVTDPLTGRTRAVYYDYTGHKLQIRAFQ